MGYYRFADNINEHNNMVLTYVVSLRDWERHVKRMRQMVLRVQRRRAPVRGRRVHGLLLAGGHGRVAGGVGRLHRQSSHRWPGGQRVDGRTAATGRAYDAAAGGGGGRLVRVELQPERGGQRRRGHVATTAVVLRTADGRRADPATTGIRRLVHRPGGVLAHWRRDGCGQPGPGRSMQRGRPPVCSCCSRSVRSRAMLRRRRRRRTRAHTRRARTH